MLRYCHDISNIKQYDDNTVILYLYFPAAVAFRNKSEASMQCACENTHTHTERPNLPSFFSPLLEHTVVEGWFTSIRSILPKPMVFGHPKAVRHHCVNIGSVPILLSSFQAEQKGSTTVSEHQNA